MFRKHRMVWCALAFSLGILCAEFMPVPWWIWISASTSCFTYQAIRGRIHVVWIVCVVLFGAGWGALHLRMVSEHDVVLVSGTNALELLVRVQARIHHLGPVERDRHRTILELDHLMHPDGEVSPLEGRVSTHLDRRLNPLEGDRIEAIGWLDPPGRLIPSSSSGSPDWVRIARLGGFRGRMTVPGNLVRILPSHGRIDGLLRLRGRIRRHCADCITRGIVNRDASSLVLALTLGLQGSNWSRIAAPFRRIGIAHLLAISGMHLGIVVGFTMLLARSTGRPGRWSGFWMIVSTSMYMLVVTWRPPVVRAAVMVVLLSTGIMLARRLQATGMLALSAIIILVFNPGELFLPGFQLSFGVVGSMIVGTAPLYRRWFGSDGPRATSFRSGMSTMMKTTLVASTLAWFASIPIVSHHFGTIAPMSVPVTILFLPLVIMVLIAGFARIILETIGSGTLLPAVFLELPLDVIIESSSFIDSIPGSSIEIEPPSAMAAWMGFMLVMAWAKFGLRESFWKCRWWLESKRPARLRRSSRGSGIST